MYLLREEVISSEPGAVREERVRRAPVRSAAQIAAALGGPPPTPEQAAVIEAPLRPLLVVAGAGSGKTETMASRVVWLVANGHVEPDQVLGLTFTRKAASELSDRIGRRLRQLQRVGLWTPPELEDGAEVLGGTPTVSTYHSYAGRLVREHALRLGIEPEARLLSEAAAWQYAAEVTESYDGPLEQIRTSGGAAPALSTVVGAVTSIAGEMAEHLLEVDALDRFLGEVADRVGALPSGGKASSVPAPVRDVLRTLEGRRQILPLVAAYLDLKRRREALDFSDQMALAARLAMRFADIGAMERGRFRAVLLDEFQDTSEAQLTLLRSLYVPDASAGPDDGPAVPVTAVGDPHQSIYGWRGASATTLSRFPREFRDAAGPAAVLPLSTSWRNDRTILATANLSSAPLRDDSHVDVQLLRARPDAQEGSVEAARLSTLEDEASHVADWVQRRWFTGPDRATRTGRSAAVLCRKRSQFPTIVAALEERGLPVEVVGLGGLLTTPEVSDIVALLSVVHDPGRGDHLMRLLTGPLCRLGAADLDGLAAWSRHLQRRDAAKGATKDAKDAKDTNDAKDIRDTRNTRDMAPESGERASIVEALDELPPQGWHGADGQRIGDVARERLAGLADVVRRLRSLTGLGLADLAGEAERALGLDIEVLARPEHTLATARMHLDAFADVAASFSASADRPTLGGFLAWLDAALEEERGLEKAPLEASLDAVQVLTVHAAKGLEWDVVAVAGLTEGAFPSWPSPPSSRWSDGRWSVGTPKDKGWCSGLDGVPYDVRGDCDGLPRWRWKEVADLAELKDDLERFVLEGGQHAIAEERRLAYVAFTRARRELLLTAHVWADGKSPRVTSRFLDELVEAGLAQVGVWAQMPEPDDHGKAVNPRTQQSQSVSWPVDAQSRRRLELTDSVQAVLDAMAETRDGATTAPMLPIDPREQEIEMLLAERDRAGRRDAEAVRMPRHLSASSVVALATDPEAFALALRRPMPTPPAQAARRGTAFHAWVEQHYAQAALVDLLDLPGSADEDPGLDEDLPAMKARFLRSEWAGRRPEAVEIAVETVVDGIAIRGRIDAVFARPAGGFTVVDWKTGAEPTGERARIRAIQLAAYRLAFARLRGIEVEDVDAAFYYAATGRTVWPELLGETDLLDVLRAVPE
jgi:DNA helicase-2/ATP-dependent DNA helicase PcrA